MASIIVSNIPEFSDRADVVRCLQQFAKPNQLEYVLYPLGKEKTKALASFHSKTGKQRLDAIYILYKSLEKLGNGIAIGENMVKEKKKIRSLYSHMKKCYQSLRFYR